MIITQAHIDAGAKALEAYVQTEKGFMASFVPWGTYQNGSQMILAVWDAHPKATISQRYNACGQALYTTIANAGYGNQVTLAECQVAVHYVIGVTRLHHHG